MWAEIPQWRFRSNVYDAYFKTDGCRSGFKKLARNMRKVHEQAGEGVRVLTVLKANAYGHGAVPLGLFLEKNKLSDFFGAASVEEALQLRQAGVTLPILVLGSIYPFEAFEYAIKNNIAITIASLDAAKAVCEIAEK